MGFAKSALQAVHEIQNAMECLENAAFSVQNDDPTIHVSEHQLRMAARIMAERTRLADLAREIQAGINDPLR